MPKHSLQRFIDAQEKIYSIVLSEITNGKKRTHWMWYIFPQIQGLGTSKTSKLYAIGDMQEAAEFLNHPVLGNRLVLICAELVNLKSNDAYSIFGSPDDLKLHSSMTLFSSVPGADPVFQKVIDKFFAGKKDEKTSHIPIILLTGKTEESEEIAGLHTGADDYITKPFNPIALQIKVHNIIKNRNKRHKRYQQDNHFKPKEIAVTSADEVFLQKVQQVLDQHLNDSEFNAESFSKHVGMSRMQLHRKMLAYTGLSTSNFIRLQRLKQAASILQSSQYNINEVAYMVGFSTPSYFIKCFKETYGTTPSEYH